MTLAELIVRTAEAGLRLQRPDGSFPAGHNGPYGDPETPVRNTAHWTITLLRAFDLSSEQRFADAARRAADTLLEPAARPMGATFLCRTNPAKDLSNGLIGQAWAIEALVAAAAGLSDTRYLETAHQVFSIHPFDGERGLWRRVNVDGSHHTLDPTFNHQLWFAAAGAALDDGRQPRIRDQVSRFLDRAGATTLLLHRSGRIRHAVGPRPLKERVGRALRTLLEPARAVRERRAQTAREVGYHAFNLYGFTMLCRSRPEHPLWRSPRLVRALRYLDHPAFQEAITTAFGGPYNPAGFEAALAIETLGRVAGLAPELVRLWVQRQLDHTFDPGTGLLARNTTDPATLAARFYEVTRLADLSMEVGDRTG